MSLRNFSGSRKFSSSRIYRGIGCVSICGDGDSITAIRISVRRPRASGGKCPHLARRLFRQIGEYLSGRSASFSIKPDLDGLGEFTGRVLRETSRIPYGRTLSYGEVARRIGAPRAARAVGQALKRNPYPIIIPCHRVVAGDGRIGGFSCGLAVKKRFLELEGAQRGRIQRTQGRNSP